MTIEFDNVCGRGITQKFGHNVKMTGHKRSKFAV